MWKIFRLCCFFSAFSYGAESAKILGIFTVPGPSHYFVGSTLFKALVERGHELTVISPYPQKTPIANYADVPVKSMLELVESTMYMCFELHEYSTYRNMREMFDFGTVMTEMVLEHGNVQKLLDDASRKFDLVIIDSFHNDAFMGFGHKYNAPVIFFATAGVSSFNDYLMSNFLPYSYVPSIHVPYAENMNFLERVHNTFIGLMNEAMRRLVFEPDQSRLLAKFFKGAPALEELRKNISLLLVNSNVATQTVRPLHANIKMVGGLHIKKPAPLPEDLKQFLDEAKDGVIYFSLGSNMKSSDMPNSFKQILLKVFSRLPQKVLWKWETDFPNKPENVRIGQWLPQASILAHPNVRVFITHGGMLSTTESVYFGVPVVGIPFFGDQAINIAAAAAAGYALKVDFAGITEEKLYGALKSVIYEPKYRQNAQARSKIMQDQPIDPLEEAVYWTEYVLRHNGAHHLRPAAVHLKWCQLHSLDVLGTAAVLIFFLIAIAWHYTRIFCCPYPKKRNMSASNKTKVS